LKGLGTKFSYLKLVNYFNNATSGRGSSEIENRVNDKQIPGPLLGFYHESN
jgi:hypothetical protein|tara:strand:- start:246 stop:398 length:153 start_codon:yes stop_codon:yes gene_type:complete